MVDATPVIVSPILTPSKSELLVPSGVGVDWSQGRLESELNGIRGRWESVSVGQAFVFF